MAGRVMILLLSKCRISFGIKGVFGSRFSVDWNDFFQASHSVSPEFDWKTRSLGQNSRLKTGLFSAKTVKFFPVPPSPKLTDCFENSLLGVCFSSRSHIFLFHFCYMIIATDHISIATNPIVLSMTCRSCEWRRLMNSSRAFVGG